MSTNGHNGTPSPSNLAISAAWETPVVPEHGGETALLVRIKPVAHPERERRRAPVDVAVVLDRSGSMSGDKLRLAKEAVDAAVAHLRDEDRAALVIYDDRVDTLQPLAPATPRVKAALRLALHGVDPGGSTNLSGGWLTGCDELATPMERDRDQTRIRRALLLTDGLANAGITDVGTLGTHATELRKRGITTSALGVGGDFDEGLLAAMAEAGGGSFLFIDRPGDYARFFAEEFGEALSVVAAGPQLSLTLPHGVRARLVNPFPVERHGERIDVALRDLSAGHEINLVFAIRVEPGARGTVHLVSLAADWTDTAADARRALELTLPPLTLADPATVAATPADTEVAELAALERADAAKREAMRLDREGRHAESRRHLRQSAQALAAAPQSARVSEYRMSASLLAEADPDQALDSNLRKRATHDAMRRSRGNVDE